MRTLKYFFYIVMVCLATINTLFFICNWFDLQIVVSNETILLTVVGFFFAFAGINIYSIFNTNIETEKQSLRDLKDYYDEQLSLYEKEMFFPKTLIMIYHEAQYLTSSKTIQINSFDWITEIKRNLEKLRCFVQKLKNNKMINKFESYRNDLVGLSKGVSILLKQHQNDIQIDGFFGTLSAADKNRYEEKITDLISFVDDLVSYSYEQEDDVKSNDAFMSKVCKVVKYAKDIFKKK